MPRKTGDKAASSARCLIGICIGLYNSNFVIEKLVVRSGNLYRRHMASNTITSAYLAGHGSAFAATNTMYAAVARRALDLGECLLAYDVLKAGLSFFPSDVPLRRSQALALARSGSAEGARAILERLRREGQALHGVGA